MNKLIYIVVFILVALGFIGVVSNTVNNTINTDTRVVNEVITGEFVDPYYYSHNLTYQLESLDDIISIRAYPDTDYYATLEGWLVSFNLLANGFVLEITDDTPFYSVDDILQENPISYGDTVDTILITYYTPLERNTSVINLLNIIPIILVGSIITYVVVKTKRD